MTTAATETDAASTQTATDAANLCDYLHLRLALGIEDRPGRSHFSSQFQWSRERYSAAVRHCLAQGWALPSATNRQTLIPFRPASPQVQSIIEGFEEWSLAVTVRKPRKRRSAA